MELGKTEIENRENLLQMADSILRSKLAFHAYLMMAMDKYGTAKITEVTGELRQTMTNSVSKYRYAFSHERGAEIVKKMIEWEKSQEDENVSNEG
jgi:hypothetical protein